MSTFGCEYSPDGEKLLSGPINKTTVCILRTAKIIFGESPTYNAFSVCSSTLESFTFESDPLLEVIQPYAFFSCSKLLLIDLSKCSHLTTINEGAFKSCTSVSQVIFPASISVLGKDAFYMDSSITSLFLPKSITILGTQCFAYCRKLKTFTLEKDILLTSLPKFFIRFTLIQNFTIPKSIKYLESAALEAPSNLVYVFVESGNTEFKSDDGVLFTINGLGLILFPTYHSTNYSIPVGVTTLKWASFSNTFIQSVTIPNTVTTIDGYCFQNTKIDSIIIPDSVLTIDQYVFNGCSKLINIRMSSNITVYSPYLFANCGFTQMIIPEGISSLMSFCLYGCKNLVEVILPSTIKTLGGGVFSLCHPSIVIRFADDSPFSIFNNYLIVDKIMENIYQYFGATVNDVVNIPSTIKTIKSGAFQTKTNIKSIVLESSSQLHTIESSAFNGCSALSFFSFIPSIRIINSYAFSQCKSLESISFGPSLVEIKEGAFLLCTRLFSISFQSVTSLDLSKECFSGCSNLTNFIIPDKTKSINDYAFATCISLKSLVIPQTVSIIGSYVFFKSGIEKLVFHPNTRISVLSTYIFYKATNLKQVNLTETIQSLEAFAFSETIIEEFVAPRDLRFIKHSCFRGCASLKLFSIPSGCLLSSIEDKVFSGCVSLSSIQSQVSTYVVENGAMFNFDRSILVAFPPASNIKIFSFPPYIRIVQPSAFIDCYNLEIVIFPEDSVTKIGFSAFEGCIHLHTINLPKCIRQIDENAFSGCKQLRCGLNIDITDALLSSQLVSICKLLPHCLHPCKSITCVNKYHRVHSAFLHVFINLIIMSKAN